MLKYQYTITYEATIDDNGNVIETKIISHTDKKQKKDITEESEPKLYLEDNKFKLTSKAVELLQAEVGDKLDINYDGNIPVIAKSETFGTGGGTKLSKSLTCSFRGNKNVELRKVGTEFKVIAHPRGGNVFILDSGNLPEEQLTGDDSIEIPKDDDFDLESLIDTTENPDTTEIKSSFFTFK